MEASTSSSSSATIARQTWEIENNIVAMDPPAAASDSDAIFEYDADSQTSIQQQKPWTRDPHFFKNVRISALALLKMVVHARSGGTIEVMGLMQGKTDGDTIIIMDAFALPVEGTETRVNAQADAYEYMVQYSQTNKQVGRLENVVGWYHSHPGYGCWLSGIDVSTQMLNQTYQEPFLAVVIDPTRTVSAGKVEIRAFRTYPQGYKPPDEPPSEYQTIPLNKIEDFGVHYKSYYSLDITYFKSSLDSHLLDLLWNKYWVNTLSSSPLLGNREYVTGQVADLEYMAVETLHPLSRCFSEGRVPNRAEFESKLQTLADFARSGDGRQELAVAKAVPTLLSLSSRVFPSTREALYEPYWSFKSFNLYVRVLRNLCAVNAINQEALVAVEGLEVIAPVVEIFARECSASSDNGESPAESIVWTSAIESLQIVLQLVGNVAGLGEWSQARIWKRFFPSVFETVAEISSAKIQGPLCMILSTCCRDNDIRCTELSEGKGAPIISLVLNGGARGVTKTAPNEWLESLIARLCFETTCFPLLFRELGGKSFTKEQASLLDILNAALSSREEDRHSDDQSTDICMPSTSASYLIDIIRSAAECAATTDLSVLELPTHSPVTDVLGLSLSITRILCVLDINRSAVLSTFASSGLIPLLLDLLRALGSPDNAKPSTIQQSSEDAMAQRFPSRDVYAGYRRDIVAVIANASHRSFTIQEAVRESAGLVVVLQQCMPDTNNPFLREWGLWAIRNLLEGNSANQSELADLEIRSVVPDSRLQSAGMTVEINPETGRPRLVNAAPSTANPTIDEFM